MLQESSNAGFLLDSMFVSVLQESSNAGFLLDSMFDFAERINTMRLSDDEVALFSAAVIVAAGQ